MYLSVLRYGGLDWHDCHTITEQLKFNNKFEIPKEKILDVVIDYICSNYKIGLSKEELKNKYQEFLDTKISIEIPILQDDGSMPEIIEDENGRYCEQAIYFIEKEGYVVSLEEVYCFGQISFHVNFKEEVIDDPCYLVYENFLAPTKGVDSIERMYRDFFENYDEAESYFDNLKLHNANYSTFGIVKEIRITSKKYIVGTKWYQLNMKANKLMNETQQTPYSKSFTVFVESHIKKLEELKSIQS